MYNLYPPIFIRNDQEKRSYISTLSNSFHLLEKNPGKWNEHLSLFLDQEIESLDDNCQLVYESVYNLGENRDIK